MKRYSRYDSIVSQKQEVITDAVQEAQTAVGAQSYMDVDFMFRSHFQDFCSSLPQLFPSSAAGGSGVREGILNLCDRSRAMRFQVGRLDHPKSFPPEVKGAVQNLFGLTAKRVSELGFPDHAAVVEADLMLLTLPTSVSF